MPWQARRHCGSRRWEAAILSDGLPETVSALARQARCEAGWRWQSRRPQSDPLQSVAPAHHPKVSLRNGYPPSGVFFATFHDGRVVK
jgi:hypothetical protein